MRSATSSSLVLTLLAGLTLGGTMTSCGGKTVTRVETGTAIELSGKWNDGDSTRVSAKMISDALSRSWLDNFVKENNRKPAVMVGDVIVRANGDTISTKIFTNDLSRAFINSDRIKIVSSDKSQTRSALKDQDKNATAESRKKAFAELGCDFVLTGEINVQDDQEGNRMVKFYSVDLKLEHVQSSETVWIGNEQIKKYIERDR